MRILTLLFSLLLLVQIENISPSISSGSRAITLNLKYKSHLSGSFKNGKLKSESNSKIPPSVGAFRKNYGGEITKVLSITGNSELTLPLLRFEDHTWEGQSIELECNATYPVQWVYNGAGAPPVHSQNYRISTDFFIEETYVHRSTITFTHTTEKQTGNYSCESIENPTKLHAYLYLFVPGNGIFMEDVEENRTIVADANEPWVTLPCSVSDSDARVILLKKHKMEGVQVMKLGSHLTFDPKVGFQIQWKLMHEPWAEYVCIAQTDDNIEQLDIVLQPPIEENSALSTNIPNWDSSKQYSSASLHFLPDELNNRLLCCSSTNERPSLKSTGCSSLSDCSLRKHYLNGKKCPPSCEQHVRNVGRTCVGYEMSEWRDSGLLQCTLGNTKEYFIFSMQDNILITNFTRLPKIEDVIQITVEKGRKPGNIFITCHVNSFFFAHGVKYAWKRPNGSMEIIDEGRHPVSYLEVEREKNIGSTIYCFAPIWNSATEWKSQSIIIT